MDYGIYCDSLGLTATSMPESFVFVLFYFYAVLLNFVLIEQVKGIEARVQGDKWDCDA